MVRLQRRPTRLLVASAMRSLPYAMLVGMVLVGCDSAPPSAQTTTRSNSVPAVAEASSVPADNALTNPKTSVEKSKTVEHQIKGQPVTATLKLMHNSLDIGATMTLTVELDIQPLWEIRGLDAEHDDAATRLELELPTGMNAQGNWQAPEPSRSQSADGHAAYFDKVAFTRTLIIDKAPMPGDHQVKCRVVYQACDEKRCLRPTAAELSVLLKEEDAHSEIGPGEIN